MSKTAQPLAPPASNSRFGPNFSKTALVSIVGFDQPDLYVTELPLGFGGSKVAHLFTSEFFMMARATNRTAFALIVMASVASAQSSRIGNVFFGFEFILHPIAIKWACGGQREQDLATFRKLIDAFPEDAQDAELPIHINALERVSRGDEGLVLVLGSEISKQGAEQLCGAARPLSVAWVTPEQLVNDDEDGVPTEQKVAWAEFWRRVESLQ